MEQEKESKRHVFQAETLDGKPVREVRKNHLTYMLLLTDRADEMKPGLLRSILPHRKS